MEIIIVIIVSFGIAAVLFCIPFFISAKNSRKYEEKLEEYDALAMEENAIHLSGLPATGREVCSIMVKNEGIVIRNARQKFAIRMDRLVGAVVDQETKDIQTVNTTTTHKPSVGKAVVGGVLFGAPGAIIGGASGTSRTTSNVRTTTVISKLFLTIEYKTNGELKQMSFEGGPHCRFVEIQNAINTEASKNLARARREK